MNDEGFQFVLCLAIVSVTVAAILGMFCWLAADVTDSDRDFRTARARGCLTIADGTQRTLCLSNAK